MLYAMLLTDSWAVQWNWSVCCDCTWCICRLSHVCWIPGRVSRLLFFGRILLPLHDSHDWSSFFKRSQICYSEWVRFWQCKVYC